MHPPDRREGVAAVAVAGGARARWRWRRRGAGAVAVAEARQRQVGHLPAARPRNAHFPASPWTPGKGVKVMPSKMERIITYDPRR